MSAKNWAHLFVERGEKLPNLDAVAGPLSTSLSTSLSASDPYVYVTIDGKQAGRSAIIRDCSNPVWNYELLIEVSDHAKKIEIQIWDWDHLSLDDLIGRVVLDAPRVLENKIDHMKEPSPITTKKGKQIPNAELYFMTRPFVPGVTPFIWSPAGFTVIATVLTAKGSTSPDATVSVGLAGQEYTTAKRPFSGFWIQEFRFNEVHPNAMLSVVLNQKDKTATGQYQLTKEDLYGEPQEIGIPLVSPSASKESKVWLHLLCFMVNQGDPKHPPLSPAPYTVHESTLFGILTGTKNQDTGRARWPCYEIRLDMVGPTFGDERQGWNKAYSAAQTIYSKGPKSMAVRAGIKSQHTAIYRKRDTDQTGNIFCGDSFFGLLHWGFRRGKPRYFTYVMTEKYLRFSETGAEFSKDIMSKHAMHACASPEVVYSGEFALLKNTEKGNLFLAIDNNSGTFAPDKTVLPKVQQIIEMNFPHIEVVAVSFDDPVFATCKERMKTLQARPDKNWNVLLMD